MNDISMLSSTSAVMMSSSTTISMADTTAAAAANPMDSLLSTLSSLLENIAGDDTQQKLLELIAQLIELLVKNGGSSEAAGDLASSMLEDLGNSLGSSSVMVYQQSTFISIEQTTVIGAYSGSDMGLLGGSMDLSI